MKYIKTNPDISLSITAGLLIIIHAVISEQYVLDQNIGTYIFNQLIFLLLIIFPGFSVFSLTRAEHWGLAAIAGILVSLSFAIIIATGTLYWIIFNNFDPVVLELIIGGIILIISLLAFALRGTERSPQKTFIVRKLQAIMILVVPTLFTISFLDFAPLFTPTDDNIEFYVDLESSSIEENIIEIIIVNHQPTTQVFDMMIDYASGNQMISNIVVEADSRWVNNIYLEFLLENRTTLILLDDQSNEAISVLNIWPEDFQNLIKD